MKLFIKLMAFVVVAAVAGPFFIKGPDGQPLMSWDRVQAPSISMPDVDAIGSKVKQSLGSKMEKDAKPIDVFRWQDEKGIWHFADGQAPGSSAQRLTVDPNINLTHFEPDEATKHEGGGDASPAMSLPTTLPLNKITTLMDDAKNVEKLQKQRLIQQERAMQD